MKIYVKKIPYNNSFVLAPQDNESAEAIKKLSPDFVYSVEIKKERNYQFLKKFFALIKVGFDNTKLDVPQDVYRKIMIMKAGFFNAYNTDKGVYYEPRSIAFDKMTEEEFEEVYNRVLDEIIKDIGATKEMIEDYLLPFIN